jgi:O-antigen/teichoic acid export membrane protein
MLLVGLVIRVFNVSGLIAGYNTAPAEERAKYDEGALTRFVGAMLILASVVLLAGGLLPHVPGAPDYVTGVSWALFTAVVIGGVVYMNTGERFKQ